MKILAHRGVTAAARENTAAAFAAAVEAGADGIETDVRRTKDGVLVLFHDRNLPDGRPLESQGFAEVRHDHPELNLLRLEEALQRWPQLFWNLEAKSASVLEPLYALLRKAPPKGEVLVSSFDHAALERVPAPMGVHLGVLAAHHPFGSCPAPLGHWPRIAGLDTIIWDFEVLDPREVEKARQRGVRSLAWGAETQAEHDALKGIPLHALITDHVARARKALGA